MGKDENNEELEEKKKEIPKLNRTLAVRQIEDINDILSNIQNGFINNSGDYSFNLSNLWWSNKTLKFGPKLAKRIDDINRELILLCKTTINDACVSFNEIAPYRKTATIYVKSGPFIMASYPSFNEMGPDGRVGMFTKDVENCTREYVECLEKLKSEVSGIPRIINFYDVNGSLVKTFNPNAGKINSVVDDSINGISNEIMNAMQEEIDLTNASVAQAVSSLKS